MTTEDLTAIDLELARPDLIDSRRVRLIVKRRELLAESEPRPTKTFALNEPRDLLASYLMLGGSNHGAESYFDDDELRAIADQLHAEEIQLLQAELREKPRAS